MKKRKTGIANQIYNSKYKTSLSKNTYDDFGDMVKMILQQSENKQSWPEQMNRENYIVCNHKPEDQIKSGYAYTVDNGMTLITGYGGALLMVDAFRKEGYSDNDICNLIFVQEGNKQYPLSEITWNKA